MNRQTPTVNTNVIRSIDSSFRIRHRARYMYSGTSAVVNRSITRGFMLNTLIMNNNGTTGHGRLFAGVKLNRIEIFSTSASPIALEWTSSLGPSREITDQSLTAASVATIKSSPPRNSLAGFWSMTGSNESEALLNLSLPASDTVVGGVNTRGQTVIDVWIEAILMDDETVVNVTTTNSGTLNQLYLTNFDGPSGATVGLVPQSYRTIN